MHVCGRCFKCHLNDSFFFFKWVVHRQVNLEERERADIEWFIVFGGKWGTQEGGRGWEKWVRGVGAYNTPSKMGCFASLHTCNMCQLCWRSRCFQEQETGAKNNTHTHIYTPNHLHPFFSICDIYFLNKSPFQAANFRIVKRHCTA